MAIRKLGRYEIQGELGRGAMGVVYKAIDYKLNRTVAIKTIGMSLDQAERAEYEARFYQEAKAAGSLNHPNIVTIYDIGDSNNVAYMAMELIDGSELRALLAGGCALPVVQAIDIAAQVADGLAFAHGRGIVHRDIKPANIMVLRDGPVKIMDFGIARMRTAEVQTQTGKLIGSPKYMAPEQVIGKRADQRADIFSLGVILYEMLVGAAPFSGDSVNALMYQTVNFLPPAPGAINRDVPEMLDYIVAKMLAKKLEERYADAKTLAADLRECARQFGAPHARAPAGTSSPSTLPPVPTSHLVGEGTRAETLAQPLPHSRQTDSASGPVPGDAPILGISREFDSLEAMQVLATHGGMEDAFDAYAATLKFDAKVPAPYTKAAHVGQHAVTPPTQQFSWLAWSARDLWILGATAFIALAVAIVVVLR
jgi:serine/threonine-protein kinase